ncbi:hypothetical protein [Pararobbsia alpina]|uniref:Uncharacterized protein n=1 Tax=Pararobbsia alpina TaxID=621374 RepID=A0A6S7D3F4_9BURK|nr:hypothetical protein [Pararobbsia alpina]CAB3805325.1 hypothetical protein LMG28138_05648 [Pararobbsia alpina]
MYFRVLLPEETEHYGGPGVGLFMWLAAQLAEGAAMLEREASTEPVVKRRIEQIIEDVEATLLHTKPASESRWHGAVPCSGAHKIT